MIKMLQLCNELFTAIKDNRFDDANELCEKLSIILSTYVNKE